MTYEEKARQRAEEMAATVFPDEHKYKDLSQMDYGKWLDCVARLEGAARLSVQREAEACEAALLICGWHQHGITEYLPSLGLVPENVPE